MEPQREHGREAGAFSGWRQRDRGEMVKGQISSFLPTTPEDARQIVQWHYDAPYDFYTLDHSTLEEDVAWFSDPANQYFSLQDQQGQVIAFVCFDADAQVKGGIYDAGALDVGWGLRPDLTGRGIGPSIIEAAVALGREIFAGHSFRATIAAFNERALKAAQKAGFVRTTAFERPSDGESFVILVREPEGGR